MPSSFAWLDFSDRDRQRAMDVVDLFREEDTRDELGIGVIRDAFADQLFPGTSTIQTRVRYFLFLPWLYRSFRPGDSREDRFANKRRNVQDKLRVSLGNGDESIGVIGSQAGASVQRLPSSVYWQGLRRWGILRFSGSESDYRRELARQQRMGDRLVNNDDGEPTGDGSEGLWDPELPDPPSGWLDATDFDLTRQEAEYLRFRLEVNARDSLLAHCIDLGIETGDTRFAWEHVPVESLPGSLSDAVGHARKFSESMYGAALLYNLMLSEEKGREEWIDRYRDLMADWWRMRSERSSDFRSWDRVEFWSLLGTWQARVRPQARGFVERWLDGIDELRNLEDVFENSMLRSLIKNREQTLKGPRSRLGNPRALDLWRGKSGTSQLDYRWNEPVKSMISDIIQGLRDGA